MSTQVILLVVGCVALLALIVRLVRTGRLSIRYGMGWMFLALLGAAGAPLLSAASSRVDGLGFTATGFSIGVLLVFLGLVCLHLSTTVSQLMRAVQELSEHGALQSRRFAQLERPQDGSDPATVDPAQADVLVVVPAFNEQEAVGEVVVGVRALGYRVCVVDDGSWDMTAREAEAAGAEVLRLPQNLGVGGALRAGFRYARDQECAIVVQVDADGQHEVADISELVTALRESGADMVIGSRFTHADVDYPVGRWRGMAMQVLAWRAGRAVGTELSDATSGFRAIGPRLLERFAYEYPVEYLGDTVEAIVIAGEHGARVIEHPVRMRQRVGGEPSAGPLASAWYTLRVLLAIELMRGRRVAPPLSPGDHGVVR